MEIASDNASQLTVFKQSELSMMQLAQVEETSKQIHEADKML
jgi:hypothetical protein